jgi:hypothetical protein
MPPAVAGWNPKAKMVLLWVLFAANYENAAEIPKRKRFCVDVPKIKNDKNDAKYKDESRVSTENQASKNIDGQCGNFPEQVECCGEWVRWDLDRVGISAHWWIVWRQVVQGIH